MIGAVFFVPVIGGVAEAAIGAITKATGAPQINIDQLETTRTQATEGTSALFVVTEGETSTGWASGSEAGIASSLHEPH